MAKLSQLGISRRRKFELSDMKKFADAEEGQRTTRKAKHQVRDVMEKDRGQVKLYLWGNQIGAYNPKTKKITVEDAGYQSVTTKDRLNRIIPRGTIFQKNFEWFYESPRGDRLDFTGRATFSILKSKPRIRQRDKYVRSGEFRTTKQSSSPFQWLLDANK